MQKVNAIKFSLPVRVVRNTRKGSPNDQWARIVNAKTGEILHTGQLRYIRRVAAERYNIAVDL